MEAAAAALELEDDVFFKDLSRQISLLIMDDDGDDSSLAHCPSLDLQAFNQAIYPTPQASFLNYSQQISRRESKGTGVFIPQSTNLRRKSSKQGRFTDSGNTFQRLSDHSSRGFLPHMASYSNNHHHHHYIDQPSSNPRRF